MTRSDAAAIDHSARIAATAVIGAPFRPLLDGRQVSVGGEVTIGAGVWVGHYVTIGEGVRIGAQSKLEDFAAIQSLAVVGSRVVVAHRSYIGLAATVGDDCVIKGHVGDNARIGARCRIAGDLIHRQLDPSIPWDDPVAEEPAPVVEDGAFVGWRAVVIGGVNIGAGAYVCAGALVTKDVPAGYIACGRNKIVSPSAWPGVLGKSPFFQDPPHVPADA